MNQALLDSHQSFPVFAVNDGRHKNWLERLLSVFADVRAGEGVNALLMASNAFALMSAYYVLKTVRQGLILSQFGPEKTAYAAGAMALLLVFLVPAYGAFASRTVRVKLISWVTLFCASHLAIFAALDAGGVRIGVAYFLWLGIVNYLLVGQFWAFANDLYDEHKGKRLFPLVGVGTAVGGLVGALVAKAQFRALGTPRLMLIAGLVLVLSVALTLVVNRREAAVAGSVQHRISQEPIGRDGGFRLIVRSRYLVLIAVAMLLLNLVNSTGEFLMNKLAAAQAAQVAATAGAQRLAFFGEFAGTFAMWQNLMVLILQLFVVSRVFRHLGVRAALFILPVIAFSGYALALAVPVFRMVRIVKLLENSTDYSIQNTAKNTLFLKTSREAKYKAKIAIDTFMVRVGDMMGSLLVLIGSLPAVAWGVRQYAAMNVGFVLVWLVIVAGIAHEHKRLSPLSAPAVLKAAR
jgi:ATP:ADP antiporter, AAA family